MPKRSEAYNWREVVPGNTKKTLWTEYYDVKDLPQVINPKSGFIYNANHSPFKSTEESENPKAENFSKTMGYELYDNNRSTRLLELINSYDKIDVLNISIHKENNISNVTISMTKEDLLNLSKSFLSWHEESQAE